MSKETTAEPNQGETRADSQVPRAIVVADHLLICVISLPDDRQFVHIDSATLKFLDRSIRIRMSVINRDN